MKNIKFDAKRLLSIITAGMLMTAPIAANADGEQNTNTGFTLVRQEMKVEGYDLNIGSYTGRLEESYNYLKPFIDYDGLQADLQILYYIGNRPYMSTATNDELIAQGVVFGEEYIRENFHRAFDLLYRINEYNEETIRRDFENGTMDINHLIDPSILCFDSHDREIVRSMFEHYFEAYKTGEFETPDYTFVFKELTTLNAEEREHNAFSCETGAMWISQTTVGRMVIEMLYDHLLRTYSIEELSVYYVREELEKGNFVLREDVPSFDLNCMKPIEYEIFNIGELEKFCYDVVNNNIYKVFNMREEVENPEVENNEPVAINNEVVELTELNDAPAVVETTGEVSQETYTFEQCVDNATSCFEGKIAYDHLSSDLNCLVFLTNREYIPEEEQADLISRGVVYETDFNTEEGVQNFMQAYSLINIILDYNQSVIREDYENGTMDINHLIDPSCLCMNPTDRAIIHAMHVEYFEAYKAGRFENEHFTNLLAMLGNDIISFGPRWMGTNIVYGCEMQALRDDMQADFARLDLDRFFDKNELNAGQWWLRSDVNPDINSSDELEREAAYFKGLWPIVYDNVNNELFASFQVNCK